MKLFQSRGDNSYLKETLGRIGVKLLYFFRYGHITTTLFYKYTDSNLLQTAFFNIHIQTATDNVFQSQADYVLETMQGTLLLKINPLVVRQNGYSKIYQALSYKITGARFYNTWGQDFHIRVFL